VVFGNSGLASREQVQSAASSKQRHAIAALCSIYSGPDANKER
jgi:hypothetical protein